VRRVWPEHDRLQEESQEARLLLPLPAVLDGGRMREPQEPPRRRTGVHGGVDVRDGREYGDRTLPELYDRAVEEQYGGVSRRASAEQRTDLASKLAELEAERKGYLRQNAREVLSDGELDEMLKEVEEHRAGIAEELRVAEDEVQAARRIESARYSLVHAQWYEDPDAVQPG
jgi:hypothetical protein